MKKYILVLLIALFSCNKEQNEVETCTTCTRTVTVVSDNPYFPTSETSTTVFTEEMTEGNCILPHSDYETKIRSQSETEITSLNALNPQYDIDPTTYTLFEFSNVTTLNSLVCEEN